MADRLRTDRDGYGNGYGVWETFSVIPARPPPRRKRCVEAVRANLARYRARVPNATRFVCKMARDGEPGDDVTLEAAAVAFEVLIRVVDARTGRRRHVGDPGTARMRVTIIQCEGRTYDSAILWRRPSTRLPHRAAPRALPRQELERLHAEREWEVDEDRSSEDVVSWKDTWETPELVAAVRALEPADPLWGAWRLAATGETNAEGLVRCAWIPTVRRGVSWHRNQG